MAKIGDTIALDAADSQSQSMTLPWTLVQWSSAIAMDQCVQRDGALLSYEVADFEKQMNSKDRKAYEVAKADFDKSLTEVLSAQVEREAKKSRHVWSKKLGDGWDKFCQTAHHYQSILDVLNDQAPEYSTAVWGAIKLLLLVSVNSKKLKEGVIESLDRIGRQLAMINVLVELQPSEKMIEAVASVYTHTMLFLKEALKYYSENRALAAIKVLAKPWDLRFKELVIAIERHVLNVQELMHIGNTINTVKVLRNTEDLAFGQAAIQKGQVRLLQIQVEQGEAQSKDLQKLMTAWEDFQSDLRQSKLVQQFEKRINALAEEFSKNTRQRAELAPMNEYLVADVSVEQGSSRNSSTLIASHIRKKDGIAQCIKAVFPRVDIVGRKLIACIQKYPIKDDSTQNANSHTASRELIPWIDATSSQLLVLEGVRESSTKDWSVNLCLEIIGAASQYEMITTLHYLAGAREDNSPEALVQTFMWQVINKHQNAFSFAACRRWNITEQRLRDAGTDLRRLVGLFEDCLTIANPPHLYVVVDGLEYIFENTQKDPESLEEFEGLMDTLKRIARSQTTLAKILMITKLPEVIEHLQSPFNEPIDPSHHKIVQLARGVHRDAIHATKTHTYRLPHRKQSRNTACDDPATLLESDDHGMDSPVDADTDRSFTKHSTYDEEANWYESDDEKDYVFDDDGGLSHWVDVKPSCSQESGRLAPKKSRSPGNAGSVNKARRQSWESDDSAFDLLAEDNYPSTSENKKESKQHSSDKDDMEKYLMSDNE